MRRTVSCTGAAQEVAAPVLQPGYGFFSDTITISLLRSRN